MQEQRSALEPFYEAFEFVRGSSSSNSGMDQQVSWNNMPQESQNLLGYTPTASNTNMSSLDIDSQGSASLRVCNNGRSSSSQHMLNTGTHEETKLQDEWTCSLGSRSGGPRIRQSQSQATNNLSLENVDIDLNSNHMENDPSLSLCSGFCELPQNEYVGMSSRVSESGKSPQLDNLVLPQSQHVSSSSGPFGTFESSSSTVHFCSGDEGGRRGVALDGQSFSHKRKNIEVTGQSSASASSCGFNPSPDLREEGTDTSNNLSGRSIASDHHYFASAAGEGSFQRNTRTRNNPLGHSAIVPPTNSGHAVQNPTNWALSNGNTGVPGNAVPTSQDGINFAVHPPVANWISHQHRQRLSERISEVVRRSILSSGSEHRVQSMNLPPRHRHLSTSQEIGGVQSGAVAHSPQQPYSRPPILIDRQNNTVSGIPLSTQTIAAARAGRNRVMSEIRNMLDLIRRRDNLLLEDVLFEQSEFFSGADVHDTHRDMRLDVDNMSYEELLALEERIGDVNTGLSEEKIIKCLKQHRYIPILLASMVEVEPCCICREEYADGDELGRLDCGHDFHTACIKQWLIRKNLCPICRTTALND